MKIFVDLSVKQFLEELASGRPAPGGGSVSALAGAMGAALVAMVARFTAGRSGDEAREQDNERILHESLRLLQLLQADLDRDCEAYRRVLKAYRLPVPDEVSKKERSRVIQEALLAANRSLEGLQLCPGALEQGNPATWSDSAVAALLARSGIEGALANVSINLEGISDSAFREKMSEEAARIRAASRKLQERIRGLLADRLLL
ncbi:MAG: cyclodeaminase/cyclohydrolase family protein [Firmicutes bacterium]|nr:cyclodeaminase/cyclohydrolase family protein [Bacillota bacterium]